MLLEQAACQERVKAELEEREAEREELRAAERAERAQVRAVQGEMRELCRTQLTSAVLTEASVDTPLGKLIAGERAVAAPGIAVAEGAAEEELGERAAPVESASDAVSRVLRERKERMEQTAAELRELKEGFAQRREAGFAQRRGATGSRLGDASRPSEPIANRALFTWVPGVTAAEPTPTPTLAPSGAAKSDAARSAWDWINRELPTAAEDAGAPREDNC